MTIAARTPLRATAETMLSAAAERPQGTLVSSSVPVAPLDPVSLYAATGPGSSLWLQPSGGVALLGIGEAWAARSQGRGRFSAISEAWSSLLAGAVIDGTDTAPAAGPRLLGGFAFDDEPTSSEVWQGYEPACLVLPALLLVETPEGSWLTVSWLTGTTPGPADLLDSWAETAARTTAPGPTSHPNTLRLKAERPPAAPWRDSVARLAGAVGRGRLDKAVLARQVALEADGQIDVPMVLRRLQDSAPESTLFAVSRGPRTFLGATPERLVSLRGRELHTVAMAGSARRAPDATTDDTLAADLMESDKEREEHAVVVAMLREALVPVVERLEMGSKPEVVRLRHVQHLVTPVSGRLRDDADVLTLVERLHPTPAVGGTPRELALELIAEEEPHERGWYAGPLGWVDRHGDGEFVVALRSGVVHGSEATLFAGCGIVADSDPEREWDESSAKLLALGSALGQLEP